MLREQLVRGRLPGSLSLKKNAVLAKFLQIGYARLYLKRMLLLSGPLEGESRLSWLKALPLSFSLQCRSTKWKKETHNSNLWVVECKTGTRYIRYKLTKLKCPPPHHHRSQLIVFGTQTLAVMVTPRLHFTCSFGDKVAMVTTLKTRWKNIQCQGWRWVVSDGRKESKMDPIHNRDVEKRRRRRRGVCHESVSQSWTNSSYHCSPSSLVEGHTLIVKVAMSTDSKLKRGRSSGLNETGPNSYVNRNVIVSFKKKVFFFRRHLNTLPIKN